MAELILGPYLLDRVALVGEWQGVVIGALLHEGHVSLVAEGGDGDLHVVRVDTVGLRLAPTGTLGPARAR